MCYLRLASVSSDQRTWVGCGEGTAVGQILPDIFHAIPNLSHHQVPTVGKHPLSALPPLLLPPPFLFLVVSSEGTEASNILSNPYYLFPLLL
jgi:hypothetical protein